MRRVPLILPLILGLFVLIQPGFSADEPVKVWVKLRDKGPAVTPASMAGQAYENAPVYSPYLQQLRGAGFAVAVTLKWQNRVSGWADSAALAGVKALPFVTGVEEMPRKAPAAALPAPLAKSNVERFWDFHTVFDSVGATALADTVAAHGLRPGEGVRIAVIDEDFYLGHSVFDSLFARGAIIDQYDFVAGSPQSVYQTNRARSHGAWVLSLIGGNLPGKAVGLAPYAKFLLYRSENSASETYVEEDYLAAALERAVDSGAQVINISLGYRYDIDGGLETPYSALDGRTRPSSLAALGAARRGALVVVAIGNEGFDHPAGPSITAPGDADSILTVGIMQGGNRCSYSSTGPSFDGRLKPEISSLGLGGGCAVYLANPAYETDVEAQSGTSFAAPVITGIAGLLRQLHPAAAVSSQKIRQALMVTGRRADSANNLVGNGLARAAEAHCALMLDTMVNTSCALASVAVKGLLVWRGGNLNTMTWPTPLDIGRARLWDLQGRSFPVSGRWNDDGEVELQSGRRLAPGTFILRIPRMPDAVAP